MRLLKIVYLLLVMGLPVLSTAQSTKTSSETMSEIFSGKTHPLSYKLKDLTREWASMRVGQSATKTDYLQMLSAVFAGGSTFVGTLAHTHS